MSPSLYSTATVGKLDKYKIELKDMRENSCVYEFDLDNQFFADVEAPDIQKGSLHCSLTVKRGIGVYTLEFHTEGVVVVLCDRCLDEMEQLVETDDTLKVKLGLAYSEEEEMIVVPEEEGYIDVAWFIYEFIALALPMKHVHPSGECNEDMMGKLGEHLCVMEDAGELDDDADEELSDEDNDEPREIDPRWNELKKMLNNN